MKAQFILHIRYDNKYCNLLSLRLQFITKHSHITGTRKKAINLDDTEMFYEERKFNEAFFVNLSLFRV